MSKSVDLAELAAATAGYAFAYLVSVGDDARAHVLAVLPEMDSGVLAVGGVGRHSQANVTARPGVTLVWPPSEPGGYSLIVDGTATVDGSAISVTPTAAIYHRPAVGAEGEGRTGSDCAPVG